MDIKKVLKSSLISLAILGMIGGSLNTTVSARRHHRYHYRTHQIYKHKRVDYRHHKVHVKRRKSSRKIKHTAPRKSYAYIQTDVNDPNSSYKKVQIIGHSYRGGTKIYHYKTNEGDQNFNWIGQDFVRFHKPVNRENNTTSSNGSNTNNTDSNNSYNNPNEVAEQEIQLINQDRAENGKTPLQESSELDQIAQIRSKQAHSNFTHTDPNTGNGYCEEDGYNLGYNPSPSEKLYGENLASGATNAKEFNNLLYTNEKPYDGGHYQNIIGQSFPYNQVGAGVYKNTISEVFK